MSITTPEELRPTAPTERIAALDVARGIALFGIFMVNIQMMVQPMKWMFEGGGGNEGLAGQIAHYATRIFFESKSYPLFSMLFGMGMVLMYDRAKAAGREFAPAYLRRVALLLAFGIAHAFFIWYGDILIYYACFALVLMWFAPRLSTRTMLTVALSLMAVAALWGAGLGYGFAQMTPPDRSVAEVTTFTGFWEAMQAGEIQGGPELPAWAAAETDAFGNGPYAHAVGMRAINWFMGTIFWMVLFGVVLHVPAMFFLGGAIMRSGALTASRSQWPRRFLLIGLTVGLPGAVAATVLSEAFGPMSAMGAVATGLTHLTGPAVSIGYIGLAVWLARCGAMAWLARAIASAGRMALTNYLMQSVLVAFIAQHWGLGMYGEITRVPMVGIVFGIYVGQLVFSSLWLKAFTMGPFEYLWRCGTYLKLPRLTRLPARAD